MEKERDEARAASETAADAPARAEAEAEAAGEEIVGRPGPTPSACWGRRATIASRRRSCCARPSWRPPTSLPRSGERSSRTSNARGRCTTGRHGRGARGGKGRSRSVGQDLKRRAEQDADELRRRPEDEARTAVDDGVAEGRRRGEEETATILDRAPTRLGRSSHRPPSRGLRSSGRSIDGRVRRHPSARRPGPSWEERYGSRAKRLGTRCATVGLREEAEATISAARHEVERVLAGVESGSGGHRGRSRGAGGADQLCRLGLGGRHHLRVRVDHFPPLRRNGRDEPSGSCQPFSAQSGQRPTSPLTLHPLSSSSSALPASYER